MDDLDPVLRSKIVIIVEKLQKLECTLLGNRDDIWIMELLFKPGFHRYHLIEWMLSKLGYDIGKMSMSGPQNSAEERMKNLQLTLSSLGICRENSHDIIKGTATVNEQFEFWCQLTDIIWLKHQISMNTSRETDEGVALSPKKNQGKYEEFEEAASCINQICESVNLNHLFRHDLDLLPPDVLREIENLSTSSEINKIPTLQEMQESAKEYQSFNLKDLNKALLFEASYDENENDDILKLNELEEKMSDICLDLKNCAETSFNDVYNDLKPLIHHAKVDAFTDDGPAFEKLETPLDNLLQLKNSFAKLESSYSKLLKTNSDLESILNDDSFYDENYVNILKLVKREVD